MRRIPSTVCFEPLLGLHRRVAQIEARLQLARDDVRRAGARVEVRHLEGGRLEVLGALIPHAAGELGQRRGQGMDRVLRQLRIGDVALHAVNGEPPAEGAAAADLDVSPMRARWMARPTTHQSMRSPRARERFHHALGAVHRRPFLVTGDQEGDRAVVLRDERRTNSSAAVTIAASPLFMSAAPRP